MKLGSPFGTMIYMGQNQLLIESRTPSASGQCVIAMGEELSKEIKERISPHKYPVILEFDYAEGVGGGDREISEVRFDGKKAEDSESIGEAGKLLQIIMDNIAEFSVRW